MECRLELREAAAGLVYAAAKFPDLPELQEETGYSESDHSQRRHTTPKKQDDESLHTTPQDGDDTEGDEVVPAHAARTFKDVEAAAQAAFESAATAAAAAKAAIELSRAGSRDSDDRYWRTPRNTHTDEEMLHRREDLVRSRPVSVRTNRGL
jgi:vacuolar protein sorting-associated protein IST1